MATFAARRLNDGFLGSITEVPNMPSNLIERAIDAYGGLPNEWESIILSPSEVAQLPQYIGSDLLHLNSGIITIIKGFPMELAQKQRDNFTRGFVINKPITDFRKRTVTKKEV